MSFLNFCFKTLSICPKFRCKPLQKSYSKTFRRSIYSGGRAPVLKVAVCGAAGRVGQPLCLLLKQSPLIDELAIYDINDTCKFATELAHIDTRCKVLSYTGVKFIGKALKGAKIVVVLAAAKGTASMSFAPMFKPNACIVQDVIEKVAHYCPQAFIAIATHPVNSMVPLASEIMKVNGVYNPKTIFGVTSLDIVRANAFVAEVQGLEPECVFVPVIGGNTEDTIIPLLSQAKPCTDFTNEEIEAITKKVQRAHDDIRRAKFRKGASLSCAFSIARFVSSLIKGMRQYCDTIEYAFVKSDAHREAAYLATPIQLGLAGVQKNYGIPELSEYEQCLLSSAIPIIADDIKKGEKYGRSATSSTSDDSHAEEQVCQ